MLRENGRSGAIAVRPRLPRSVVTEGHVVIRVRATSFKTIIDVFTVRGMPGIKVPMPMIIGLDMAGENRRGRLRRRRVESRRPRARESAQSAERPHGRDDARRPLAEKCLVAQHQLIRMPDKVSSRASCRAARSRTHGASHDRPPTRP